MKTKLFFTALCFAATLLAVPMQPDALQDDLSVFNQHKDRVGAVDDDTLRKFASAAVRLQRFEDAIGPLSALHAKYPQNIEIAIEYAMALYHTGAYASAKSLFDSLDTASLPFRLRALVASYAERAAAPSRYGTFKAALLAGVGYDDNIRNDDLDNLPVNPNADVIGDGFHREFLLLQHTLPIDAGFGWRSAGTVYNKSYFSNPAENITQIDVKTGPSYERRSYRVIFPLGFSYLWYGQEGYLRTFYIEPELTMKLSEHDVWRLAFKAASLDYDQARAKDYDQYAAKTAYDHFQGDHRLSLFGFFKSDIAVHDIRNDVSKMRIGGGAIYGLKLPYSISTLISGRAEYRDYEDVDRFFDSKRTETRWQGTAVVSRSFSKHFLLSLDYKYVNNAASIAYYSYEKNVVTLNGMILF